MRTPMSKTTTIPAPDYEHYDLATGRVWWRSWHPGVRADGVWSEHYDLATGRVLRCVWHPGARPDSVWYEDYDADGGVESRSWHPGVRADGVWSEHYDLATGQIWWRGWYPGRGRHEPRLPLEGDR